MDCFDPSRLVIKRVAFMLSSQRVVSRDPEVLFLLLSFAFMLSSRHGVSRDPVILPFAFCLFICVICVHARITRLHSADALCL